MSGAVRVTQVETKLATMEIGDWRMKNPASNFLLGLVKAACKSFVNVWSIGRICWKKIMGTNISKR